MLIPSQGKEIGQRNNWEVVVTQPSLAIRGG